VIPRWIGLTALAALGLLAVPYLAGSQTPPRVHRVGVIHVSGVHHEVVVGLRQGLKELGLEEDKQFVIDVRETTFDVKAFEGAARDLEQGKADLIYAITTQVALAAKRATTRVPIVFYAGVDPVSIGLTQSIARPGGRVTGVHGLSRDLTGKRLSILKEILPRLERVVTFYNPDDLVSEGSAGIGRDVARTLGVHVIERHVRSVEELRSRLRELQPRDADAYFHTPGALVTSQALEIIETTRSKKMPAMFHEQSLAAKGALASYGSDYRDIGRVTAKYVQRILTGSDPRNLPVQNYDKVGLALNLRTAREIGVTVPRKLILQADHVIE
jgi:putative ABC transport system substrate-binding protein